MVRKNLVNSVIIGYFAISSNWGSLVVDKNPKSPFADGGTLLHNAAWNGNLDIFKLIFENVDDKNPKSDYGVTPLHYAAERGNLEVFKLIFSSEGSKIAVAAFHKWFADLTINI